MLTKRISSPFSYVLLAALWFFSLSVFANPSFELLGVNTQAGEKNAYIAKENGVTLPVTVVNGLEEGPVLLLTAGIHGDEFPSMFGLQQLAKELDPKKVKGTVIIVHVANLDGFHGRRLALNPRDEKNLNREFPGSKNGTPTEQIADLLTREFIARCDFLIDMHSGSSNQKLLNHVYSPFVGDEKLDALTFEFAKATGMQHIVMYGDRPRDPDNSISYPNTAMTRGKPGLTTEIGHLAQYDEASVNVALDVAKNAMYFLDMLPGDPKQAKDIVIYDAFSYIKSSHDGFFKPLATIGDDVQVGTVLGEVTDYFGNVVQRLTADKAGKILMINETPPVKQGESAITIGIIQ